jgi:SAM-dependent methyltransferase
MIARGGVGGTWRACGEEPPFGRALPARPKGARRPAGRSSNAAKHENPNPIQRALISRFHAQVVSCVRRASPSDLLDLGCGEGYTLAVLAEAFPALPLTGIDVSADAIADARRRVPPHVSLMARAAESLRGTGRRWDLVMMLEVLEHLPDPGAALALVEELGVRRVLLSVPWEPWFRGMNLLRGRHWGRLGNDPEHRHCWSRGEFLRLVQARFRIEATPFAWPWTLVLASRGDSAV